MKTFGDCKVGDSLFCYYKGSDVEERKISILSPKKEDLITIAVEKIGELHGLFDTESTFYNNYYTTREEAVDNMKIHLTFKANSLKAKKRQLDRSIKSIEKQIKSL